MGAMAMAALVVSLPARAQSVADARAVIERYSQAMLNRDTSTLARMTASALVNRIGSVQKTERWLAGGYAALAARRMFPIAERIGEIRSYSDAKVNLYFVESVRSIEGFPRPIEFTYLYLVDTKDKGKTWEVLDLACVNRDWVSDIAPSFGDWKSVEDLLPK
jgi:hypothetical protein